MRLWGEIGVTRSTNHWYRIATSLERQPMQVEQKQMPGWSELVMCRSTTVTLQFGVIIDQLRKINTERRVDCVQPRISGDVFATLPFLLDSHRIGHRRH